MKMRLFFVGVFTLVLFHIKADDLKISIANDKKTDHNICMEHSCRSGVYERNDKRMHQRWPGFSIGMGIGGWLTNYKRFNVLPENKRLHITKGDLAHFDSYITKYDVERIKRWGFDHIRVGFDQIVLEECPGKWRESTFSNLVNFVTWCDESKINVVLNLHKAIGNYCDIEEAKTLLDSEDLQQRFISLWLEIERRLKDKPNVAFELLNEVRDVPPEKWNILADKTINALRAKNKTRWIVVGSTRWNSPSTLKHLKVWDDPKVVYTFHMYSPFIFTHQRGVLQPQALYVNEDIPYPGKAEVERNMKPAVDWAKAHPDKILWNGEFGTIRHMTMFSRVSYMRDVISVCQKADIPWSVWNYLSTPNDGNRFSLVDDNTRDFLSGDLLLACLGKGDVQKRGELRYMSFNIWGDYFGNPVYERDLKMADYILRSCVDIIGMQEVTGSFWKSRLFKKLDPEFGVIRDGKDSYRELNPLLWRKSRLELIEGGTHVFALSDNPERSKGFSWGVFKDKITGKMLISYSTHLWWKRGAVSDAMRINNANELLAKIAGLKKKYACAVVGGGDLNCTVNFRANGSKSPLESLEKAGLADAQYTTVGASKYSSHHGNPVRDHLGELRGFVRENAHDPNNSLDHVHYSTNAVTPIALLVDRDQAAMEASDHSPVIFTFKIK